MTAGPSVLRPSPGAVERLGETLVHEGVLEPAGLEQALSHQRAQGGTLGDALISLHLVDEREVLRALARKAQLKYLTAERVVLLEIELGVLERVPVELAEQYEVFPYRISPDGGLRVLCSASLSEQATRALCDAAGCAGVTGVLVRRSALQAALRQHYHGDGWAFARLLPEPPGERESAEAQTREVQILSTDAVALERENHRLRIGRSFAVGLSGALELEGFARRLLGLMFEFLPGDAAALVVAGDHGGPLMVQGRRRVEGAQGLHRLEQAALRASLAHGRPEILGATAHTRVEAMTAPLFSERRALGILYVESSLPGVYTDDDLELFSAVAAQVAPALETALGAMARDFASRLHALYGRRLPAAYIDQMAEAGTGLSFDSKQVEATCLWAEAVNAEEESLARLDAFAAELERAVFPRGGWFAERTRGRSLAVFHEAEHAERAVVAAFSLAEAWPTVRCGLSSGPLELAVAPHAGVCARGHPEGQARSLAAAALPGEVLADVRTQLEAGRFHTWEAQGARFRLKR